MIKREVKNNNSLSEANLINSIKEEAKLLNKINSEYVVGFREIISTVSSYYIIQEKCDTNLRCFLKNRNEQNHPLSEKEAIDFIVQILNGYYSLLILNYIHRDLKPQNILMKNGKIKLADFGFSKRILGTSLTQTRAGTEGYLAPEIQCGSKYSSKCDIYSLGCIFYELLYSKMLFKDNKSKEKILARMHEIENYDDWFPLDREVSKESKDLIKKCLRFKEEDRISWTELYSVKIFEKRVPNLQELENSFEHLIYIIRSQINNSNTTSAKFLLSRGLRREKQIDIGEFTKFLISVIPPDSPFTPDLLKYSFQNFDANKSGRISFDQFLNVVGRNNSLLTKKESEFKLIEKVFTKEDGNEVATQESMTEHELDLRSRSNLAYHKLINELIKSKIGSLEEEYLLQDLDETGIDLESFRIFLKQRLGLSLTNEECDLVFVKLDDDNNQKIDINEFTKYITQELTTDSQKSQQY